MSSRHALSASRPRLQAVNERLRLRSRSSPPDEDRRRSPPRNRRRHRPARRLLPVPAARPRPLVLGYVRPWGSWNPCTRPAARLSDGPRAPTPAPAARRRGRACPPGQTPAPPPGTAPGPPTRRHSTEAGRRATPARPCASKPSRWNDQRSRSWPLRLGAASSPRRARSQSAAEPDARISIGSSSGSRELVSLLSLCPTLKHAQTH